MSMTIKEYLALNPKGGDTFRYDGDSTGLGRNGIPDRAVGGKCVITGVSVTGVYADTSYPLTSGSEKTAHFWYGDNYGHFVTPLTGAGASSNTTIQSTTTSEGNSMFTTNTVQTKAGWIGQVRADLPGNTIIVWESEPQSDTVDENGKVTESATTKANKIAQERIRQAVEDLFA